MKPGLAPSQLTPDQMLALHESPDQERPLHDKPDQESPFRSYRFEYFHKKMVDAVVKSPRQYQVKPIMWFSPS